MSVPRWHVGTGTFEFKNFTNKNHFHQNLFEAILISEFTDSEIRITSTLGLFDRLTD